MDKQEPGMSLQSSNSRGCLFCPSHEFGWHYEDVGHGPPLILLHGIGMSHFAWMPIMNNLAGMSSAGENGGKGASPMFRFTIRELLLVTALVAVHTRRAIRNARVALRIGNLLTGNHGDDG